LVRNSYEGGIAGLSFLNADKGWACGYNGTILKTFNGGTSWEAENSGINSAIGELVIFNNSGFAVGENGIILKYLH
jgi:photosystem II stability/assembly factor-like uncharacterized protein